MGFGKGFQLFPLAKFPARHAVIFGAVVAGLKTGFSDWIVQRVIEGKGTWSEIDWTRVGMFTAFGFMYLGGIQYFVYVPLFTRVLFPGAARFVSLPLREKMKDRRGQAMVMKQVLLDLCIHEPFLYFPIFYILKERCYSDKSTWIQDALGRWRTNFVFDVKMNWMIWLPGFAFNFAFCPVHLRVPFVALVSFGWTIVLSVVRGGEGREVCAGVGDHDSSDVLCERREKKDKAGAPLQLEGGEERTEGGEKKGETIN